MPAHEMTPDGREEDKYQQKNNKPPHRFSLAISRGAARCQSLWLCARHV